jgi:nitroreductase
MIMQTVSSDVLLAQLQWRYAVKAFDASRKIPQASWEAIEQSLVLSPSSFGLQPWRFVTVANPALRAELRKHAWNQGQVTDASHYVVIAAKDRVTEADVEAYVQRIMQVRGGGMNPGLAAYREMMLGSMKNEATLPGANFATYTRSQAYIALGFALYTAAAMGIDACPMEGFDPAQYDTLLGLKGTGYHSVVSAAFGYRASSDWLASLKKVRYEADDLFIRR